MSAYTFTCRQLFNVFGAPGIPNTYEACLYKDGKAIQWRQFHFRRKAERQCERWHSLYGAAPS
ncbi:hypothetical protein [Rhodococcus erythropolis]|uniref:hypothetical protein n=1 Tax=Rhodococcus erythropolis TaxID=1833 RepID=UPI001BE505ED|nr:hypothetical protein [Rhodococcus erythropolis]MBT2266434.1 hypothetical protein [Rhodococcus erythropolis]